MKVSIESQTNLKPITKNLFNNKFFKQIIPIKQKVQKPFSEYYMNLIKISKNKRLFYEKNSNKLPPNTSLVLSLATVKSQQTLPKICPTVQFRKLNIHKKLKKSINERKSTMGKANLESNFMKLNREANMYTSNATYIKNKKLVIRDRYTYDNNVYKPDRLGLFDLSDFSRHKMKHGSRLNGKIYFNHNKFF